MSCPSASTSLFLSKRYSLSSSELLNFAEYITFYIGSPVPTLNEIIQRNEIGNSEYFGQETFKGIQGILSKFGLIDYYNPYQRNPLLYFLHYLEKHTS